MTIIEVPVDDQMLKSIQEFAEAHTHGDVSKMAGILLFEKLTGLVFGLNEQGNMEKETEK